MLKGLYDNTWSHLGRFMVLPHDTGNTLRDWVPETSEYRLSIVR